MSAPKTTTVEVNNFPCRVWTKGSGPKLGFLAGLGGLPRWLPFLDRLAETRTVIAPSLPGYPGATGQLSEDELDRIQRLLVWEKFDGGIARPIGGGLQVSPAAP